MKRRRAAIKGVAVQFFSRDECGIFRSRCVETYDSEHDAAVAGYVYEKKAIILLADQVRKKKKDQSFLPLLDAGDVSIRTDNTIETREGL
jgi:hypothetical protein